MQKGLILLASGVEDVEALTTIDILRRARIRIDTVGVTDKTLVSQAKNTLIADYELSKVKYQDYDFLVIPGGAAVFQVLKRSPEVSRIIDYFYQEKKYIFAICAAPSLIAAKGYFRNQVFTAFPGSVKEACEGKMTNKGLVVSDQFITAKAVYYAVDFAVAIVEKLLGKDAARGVLKQIKGEF